MLCELMLLLDRWITQLLHAVHLCLCKAFQWLNFCKRPAERPAAPFGRKDVNAKHTELQMINHSVLFNRQWE